MTLITILLLAVITFGTRYLFIHPKLPIKLGPKMVSLLRFSAPAVLTAIWVPIIFIREGSLDMRLSNPYLLSATVAVIVALRTKNIYLTLAFSMLLFVLLRFFHH